MSFESTFLQCLHRCVVMQIILLERKIFRKEDICLLEWYHFLVITKCPPLICSISNPKNIKIGIFFYPDNTTLQSGTKKGLNGRRSLATGAAKEKDCVQLAGSPQFVLGTPILNVLVIVYVVEGGNPFSYLVLYYGASFQEVLEIKLK